MLLNLDQSVDNRTPSPNALDILLPSCCPVKVKPVLLAGSKVILKSLWLNEVAMPKASVPYNLLPPELFTRFSTKLNCAVERCKNSSTPFPPVKPVRSSWSTNPVADFFHLPTPILGSIIVVPLSAVELSSRSNPKKY